MKKNKKEEMERIKKIKLELANKLFKIKEKFDPCGLTTYYEIILNKKIVNKKIGCTVTKDAIECTGANILDYTLKEFINQIRRETAKEIFNNPHAKKEQIVINTQVPENTILLAINPNTYCNNISNFEYYKDLIQNVGLIKNEKEKTKNI